MLQRLRDLISRMRRTEAFVPSALARGGALLVVAAVIQRVYEMTVTTREVWAMATAAWALLFAFGAIPVLPFLWRGSRLAAAIALGALALSCVVPEPPVSWDQELIRFGQGVSFRAGAAVLVAMVWLGVAVLVALRVPRLKPGVRT